MDTMQPSQAVKRESGPARLKAGYLNRFTVCILIMLLNILGTRPAWKRLPGNRTHEDAGMATRQKVKNKTRMSYKEMAFLRGILVWQV
jgi:hypothetical protein